MTILELACLESFFIGGETKIVERNDGTAENYVSGAMYVQRLCPKTKTFPHPIIFIHGGSHTGVTWETTPDGREGWANHFVRRGFEVYIVDQAWRGRSAPDLVSLDPRTCTDDLPPTAWLVGSLGLKLIVRDGGRFPMTHANHYMSQFYPDFGINDAVKAGLPGLSADRAVPALVLLMDRLGKAVLVTHSQGGHLGWRVALARPDKVAGIVAVEPGVTCPGLDHADFPNIPVRIIWGDNLYGHGHVLSVDDLAQAKSIASQRPLVSVDFLPEAGIAGNGHMMMMEDNNAELADRTIKWLRDAISSSV